MASSPAESPLKASNISEFVHKVAQAYKRRPSSGAKQWEQRVLEDSNLTDGMASEGSMSSNGMATPSRNRSTEEVDFPGQKGSVVSTLSPAFSISTTTPLSDPSLLAVKVRVMEALVTNIFSTISALKSSYTQLQAAHNPHDPVRLEIADKAVIAEFRRFSELKESYLERNAIVSGQSLDQSSAVLSVAVSPTDAILKSNAGIISNFNVEIEKKNVEAENLKDMLAESTLRREKLERRVKRLEQKVGVANEGPFPIADLLQAAVQRASEISRTFTKLLVSLMKAAEWDLDAASDSIEPDIIYVRRSHRKHAFESYVCQQMWNGFENADFYVFGSLSSILDPEKHRRECYDEFLDMKTMDPLELVSVNPGCLFAKFCQKKFLQLVHPKMETSFFGNFDHRNQITEGSHPNSQFYHSFLRLAKAVWLVHRLAFASNPTATIFQAKRGTDFTSVCMESVVPLADQTDEHSLSPLPPLKVGFIVMPGFRVEKGVIRCQVYLQD